MILTLSQEVTVRGDHRMRLDLKVPETVPPGRFDAVIVLAPASQPSGQPPLKSSDFIGVLRNSKVFEGDPAQIQKAMRSDWDRNV